jgi:hypothetical protein
MTIAVYEAMALHVTLLCPALAQAFHHKFFICYCDNMSVNYTAAKLTASDRKTRTRFLRGDFIDSTDQAAADPKSRGGH